MTPGMLLPTGEQIRVLLTGRTEAEWGRIWKAQGRVGGIVGHSSAREPRLGAEMGSDRFQAVLTHRAMLIRSIWSEIVIDNKDT